MFERLIEKPAACVALRAFDFHGARGGRTLTVLLPTDFKSVASADSAIAPARVILPKKYVHALFFESDSKKSVELVYVRVS